jgi:hypothetical protein
MNPFRYAAMGATAAVVIFSVDAPTYGDDFCGGTIRGQMKLESDVICGGEEIEIIGPASIDLNGFTVDCDHRRLQIKGHSARIHSGVLRHCDLRISGNNHGLHSVRILDSTAIDVNGDRNNFISVQFEFEELVRDLDVLGLRLVGHRNLVRDSRFLGYVQALTVQGDANNIMRSFFIGEGVVLSGRNNMFRGNEVHSFGEITVFGSHAQIIDNILATDGWSFNVEANKSNVARNAVKLLEFHHAGRMTVGGNNNLITRNVVEAHEDSGGVLSVSGMSNILIRNEVEGDRGRMEDHNIGCDANRWIMNSAATSNQACVGTGVVVE